MTWLTELIRPDLLSLKAYQSARSEADGFLPAISIDANEFPWEPFHRSRESLPYHRYPEQQPSLLRGKLAALWNISPEHCLLTRGSDEGIDTLIRLFCVSQKDHILVFPPTYGMYKVAARIQGAFIDEAPLKEDGQIDFLAFNKQLQSQTKLIFLPSPNAPMGHEMRMEDIIKLLELTQKKHIVVIDEAYREFCEQPFGTIPFLKENPHLVILRTLSKAHALAGERIGTVIAHPNIVTELLKILPPYPLTQSSIQVALEALSPEGIILSKERRGIISRERKRMEDLLLTSPYVHHVYPSVANFLLIKTGNAHETMNRLRHYGILARSRHTDIPDTIRLSISTPEENTLVLKALGVALPAGREMNERLISKARTTKETSIDLVLNLDRSGFCSIETGIPFFDHMLEQLSLHGAISLSLHARGDLAVDQHHTVEDCALLLGGALKDALGDKSGIQRYGFQLPLDEALGQVTLDLSGRPYFKFEGHFPATHVGSLSTEMIPHFFQSLAYSLQATLHMKVEGENSHHMIEALFKAMGRTLRQAISRRDEGVPSSKGVL